MLACALTDHMRGAIDQYCWQNRVDLRLDTIEPEDWIVLSNIHDCLKYFHEATLATEGHNATLDQVLFSMKFLLEQLEIGKREFQEDPILSPCFNSVWEKMDKYYSHTDQ
jgi:hypothetical protein